MKKLQLSLLTCLLLLCSCIVGMEEKNAKEEMLNDLGMKEVKKILSENIS